MRVLVTSSRNTFALDIIRKLGSRGHTVVASDTYGGASGSHSKYLAGHAVTASPGLRRTSSSRISTASSPSTTSS